MSYKERFNSVEYHLEEQIGSGGFGEVYKATQLNTGQTVAIKFLTLNPDWDASKKHRKIERFKRETMLGSRLNHPHIVRLLNKGQCDDDLLYAVFEYVDGISLKQALDERGSLPPVEATLIMTQVLDALGHAHEKGVIHRDIKPTNIMMTKVGLRTHAKVLDFGISTLIDEDRQLDYQTLTLTQETLCTPTYSAPEQLRGDPPTPKTDIYVWGLVFIECLTGQPAVKGANAASIFHKQLSQSNVSIPPIIAGHPLSALLRRVLQKKIHERTVTIEQLYEQLSKLNVSNIAFNDNPTQNKAAVNARTISVNNNLTATQTMEFESHTLANILSERKQVTILFIKLDILSVNKQRLDYEIVQTLHSDKKNQCIDIAVRYGAHHVGSLGKTLMFYFGYPTVTDNDSRFCARAALDIVVSLNKRNSLLADKLGIISQVHIGIHTGMVTSYADGIPEGDAPDIAMDLAHCAKPNQILCSNSSKTILEPFIEFSPAKAKALGVQNTDIQTWTMIGERQVEAYGFLRTFQRTSLFLGRQEQLDSLKDIVKQTQLPSNQGQFAHIFGEAGIGKSRLIFEFRNSCDHYSHEVIQCLPEHKHNALFPVLKKLKQRYSLNALSPQQATDKLASKINQLQPSTIATADKQDAIATICAWLDLPVPNENATTNALAPKKQKQLLLCTLTALFTLSDKDLSEKAPSKPQLFIFEDLHWADLTTLEFIAHFINCDTYRINKIVAVSTSRAPLPSALATQNPDIIEASETQDASTLQTSIEISNIEVKKLTKEATSALVLALFDKHVVDNDVIEAIVNRADGIPLFIEELVLMLKDKQLIHLNKHKIQFVSQDKLALVPNSLRDSLQQRLDSLIYAKETAQIAAVIGRQFDYATLVNASSRNEDQIQSDLNELVEAQLIYPQRKVDGEHYLFKHALLKDVAYESIPTQVQKTIHAYVGEAIEAKATNQHELNTGVLSFHFAKCDRFEKAATYAKAAAEKAMSKSIYHQAIHYGNSALAALKHLDDKAMELNVNQLLTTATMTTLGWAAPEVDKLITHSQALLNQMDDEQLSDKFSICWALATYYNVRGFHSKTSQLINSTLNLKGIGDGEKAALYALKAHSLATLGKLTDAFNYNEKALSLYDDQRDLDHAAKFGHDTKVFALCTQSTLHCIFDEDQKMRQTQDLAEQHATKLSSIHSLCMVKLQKISCLYNIKAPEQAVPLCEQLMEICQQENIVLWQSPISMLHGWATNNTELIESAFNNTIAMGITQNQGYWKAMIIETLIHHNKIPLALKKLQDDIAKSEILNENSYLPELFRLKGICHSYLKQYRDAKQSIDIAKSMAIKMNMKRLIKEIEKAPITIEDIKH